MCGQTDALALTHLTVTTNRKELTWSNMIPYNVIWPFETGQRHTFEHPYKFHSNTISWKMTYLRTLTSPCISLFLYKIYWISYWFTLSLSLRINPECEKKYFTKHSSISTHALVPLFTLGLKWLSASTLTHVSWYKLLLVARYGDCKKIIKELLYNMKIDVQNK